MVRRLYNKFPVRWETKLEVAEAFGKVLRRIRVEQGLTQEDLALQSELDRKYVSLLELAAYQTKVATVFRLAKVLGYKASELIAMVEQELEQANAGTVEGRMSRRSAKRR